MGNQGIISQFGFEYQKLVFLHFAIQMAPGNTLTYEGEDDVDSVDNSIYGVRDKSFYIQVKSGNISLEIFYKILCNWLLNYKSEMQYVCFTEFPIRFDYSSTTFIDNFVAKLKTKGEKSTSLYVQVRHQYNVINDEKEIRSTIGELIERIKIECKSISDLQNEDLRYFIQNYCEDTNVSFLQEERLSRLQEKLINSISESLQKKKSFSLSHGQLFSIISSIKEATNNDHYEEDFSRFKEKKQKQIDVLLDMEKDSVKQLKLAFPDNKNAVLSGLTEQEFYEDLREVFVRLNREDDINALEFLAHSNYEDALQEISAKQKNNTPYEVYKTTTDQPLQSRLLSQQSSSFKFYNRGCYIHLTDSDVPTNLKIWWGKIINE